MLTPRYPILTERLALRAFRTGDLEAVHAIHSRPDVARYLYGTPQSLAESRVMLKTRMGQRRIAVEGDALVLAIERRDSGIVIGHVKLIWTSDRHRQGELGFVLHPDHHGHGFAREAAARVLDLAFGELGLRRVYGRCDARNAASAGLMERLGMRREAHFRHNELFKGKWSDEYVYAILAEEWPAPAKELEIQR